MMNAMGRLLSVLKSRWGIAVLAAVSTGSLLGIALGARSPTFFSGVLAGALFATFAIRTLGRAEPPPPARTAGPKVEGSSPEVYDLERDRSTDSQRWPM
jgi:hypothetical protein